MRITEHTKTIIKNIQYLGSRHSTWQVFEDFVAMSAISLSNGVDWLHRDQREQQYLDIVKRYNKKELDLFPEMFASLVLQLESCACVDGPQDVLGPIYHELELHNKYKGQFFTPQNICDLMGLISLSEDDRSIAQNGFISVGEPCAGSGAMVLGFAKAMQKNHFDFQRQMVVTATDIDLKCVYMTYIQLSLYGIPAVVIHGDTLRVQEWSRWYTPVYMLDGWVWRRTCGNIDKGYPEDEAIKRATEPMYAAIRDAERLMASVDKKPINADANPVIANEKPVPAIKTPAAVTVAPVFDVDLKEVRNGQLSLF